ncbi:NUDIX domain-containing protein [Microbacterium sp. Clip185]|uniref:NUDIX domain-containing protein n=1 Tax=Microbacterium sp. Clip185 TaxID=3025663 RepID=UPI0023651FBB|nr:NUDIX domain-containing protein [Microbacterium sp. Clip185]WDG18538.1 NUDIX domain-containing protein [Microbacterium sp. Clip185]
MTAYSAGLLLFRPDTAEVLIAHMGGPFWQRKQAGAWSIPKGEYDPASEDPLAAAEREFQEELGLTPPAGERVELGEFRYSSGKRLRVFALDADGFALVGMRFGEFSLEWPPRSGRMESFPEVDRAEWVQVDDARDLLVAAQRPVLDALAPHLVG